MKLHYYVTIKLQESYPLEALRNLGNRKISFHAFETEDDLNICLEGVLCLTRTGSFVLKRLPGDDCHRDDCH